MYLRSRLKNTNIKIKYLGCNIKIQTLYNSTILFCQCIKMTFKIAHVFTSDTFYAENKNFQQDYKIELGYEYLKAEHIILDFEDRGLRFKSLVFDLNTSEEIKQHHINELRSVQRERDYIKKTLWCLGLLKLIHLNQVNETK